MKKHYLIFIVMLFATEANAQISVIPDSMKVNIGYVSGNQKSTTGAVDQLSEDRMKKGFVANSLDALSGQAAGVSVSSNQEAMLSAVRVRGTTSITGGNNPLVIIDGVSSDLATLSTIYPADIESFTILKDASETAQYGSRGASGVIQVQTKKGKGEQFHISYDGTAGFESVYSRLNMMDGDEFRSFNQSLGNQFIDHGYNTDFQKSIERTGFIMNHHVAFGGGTPTANYRASLGVMEHNTVVKDNNYRNYIAKLDVQQKAFDNHLTFDLGVFGSIQKNSPIPDLFKLMYSAATFNPTFSNAGNLTNGYDQVTEALLINNPNSLLEKKQDEEDSHFNTHLKATADLGCHLIFTAFGSYSYSTMDNAHYYPTIVWSHGEAYRASGKTEEVLGNISLAWNHDWNEHHLELLGLAEAQGVTYKDFHVTAANFTTDQYGYNNLAAGTVRLWEGTGSSYEDAHMESFLARASYTFKNRYTVTANARADASSKFGASNRWGFFPSVSGSWVISDEEFMKPITWVSNLKFRIGYGLSGNEGGISAYNSLQLLQPTGVVPSNGTQAVTLGIVRNANPDLKWEIKRTFNTGLDMSFWNGRIMLTLDYYYSKTTDMLYNYKVSVPPFAYNNLLANLGSMSNQGLEIGFGITPVRQKDMELSINVNMAFEKNKLLSLNGYYGDQYLTTPDITAIGSLQGAGFHGTSDVVYQIVGQPLGVFYLPHCEGINAKGEFILSDIDGNGTISTTDDRYVCGQATPKMVMGSNIAFRYKQWDVTVQINGAFGHKIYNGTANTYYNLSSLPNYNVFADAPSRKIYDQRISDYYLESGDYVNIDYITLGWNVPVQRFTRYIHSLRVSCSVDNLATITGYSGQTPMINSSVVSSTLGIDDKNIFPVHRSFTLGLSVQF